MIFSNLIQDYFQGLNKFTLYIFPLSFIEICLLVGVLDRFLFFQVFVIFLTPIQDKLLEILGINQVNILPIFTKFFKDLLLVEVLGRFLDFHVYIISLMLQKTIIHF